MGSVSTEAEGTIVIGANHEEEEIEWSKVRIMRALLLQQLQQQQQEESHGHDDSSPSPLLQVIY